MEHILDTQIVIWALTDCKKLSKSVLKILTDNENILFASQNSLFEISIKQKIGKLPLFTSDTNSFCNQLIADGFGFLQIKNEHIAAYENIPLHDDNRDPFNRLLLATSVAENIPVISADEKFLLYKDVVQLFFND
ncbi:type II toxin-antitoxin system VapC family toxin [Ferruginibacter sp.]|uniref:type II toxin-antitoxin system VapC family toxin n=1 Tax=Ferruginibacter sp. TaxID=1940288 RepID=UPI00374D7347